MCPLQNLCIYYIIFLKSFPWKKKFNLCVLMCMHLHDIQEEGGGSFFQIVSTGLSALTLSTFIHGDPLPTPKTSSNRYFHSSFFSCKIIASREGFLAMQGINTFFVTLCAIFSSWADCQETEFVTLFPCLVLVTFCLFLSEFLFHVVLFCLAQGKYTKLWMKYRETFIWNSQYFKCK